MDSIKYEELKTYLSEGKYRDGMVKTEKYLLRRLAKDFELDRESNMLYYVKGDDKKRRVVIKGKEEMEKIFLECHNSPIGGHSRRDNTIFKIKERYYWLGFYADTVEMVSINFLIHASILY